MNPEDVKALLEAAISDCQFQVESQGSHFNIIAIGSIFDGKRPVQRQQAIYAALNEKISSGVIHAVNMKTFTPSEWDAQQ
ncbi:MAG: BolA/IbaG family iron-sulfur metabolism protein [Porticoccaceae bacterium]|jgi:acid stress-induced BolA-like protein IbaG/YrbA|nr:MAG: cell division protein BolA [SAR92 bacterium BACL16 MAG-120619-bin48]MDO7635868.1 BolA/IbaG family iron-sulfur metabolism protein [Porticoccaceae bacterium]MDP4655139.1 BolA/IbaG family iron-sulfur metabolism protein [Alphaproteobacteria bacterium]MDP4745882.1 BolA/IbaG family iron-sulfur metabolism protein [Porticoccaceae bacterium]MDP4753716.1 BolA/IbaG family iron-sulfur metabolism protein [Porticoccaceae bacterium]